MKNSSSYKHNPANTGNVSRKASPVRVGPKTFSHRYERRKIREQLRHLDWALAGID